MTADANRSEAIECMNRAREAIKAGHADKAKKFLEKAKRLDPSQNIAFLLQKADDMNQSSSSRDSEERSYAHDDHYEDANLRQRQSRQRSPVRNGRPATAKAAEEKKPRSASRTPKLGVDYTKEQQEVVERIRHCKDYYEILRVEKTATDDDIRREYRKMALKLHPDKCRAPHATESFKALGNAYAVLSDPEKRRQYDQYGADAANGVSHSHSHSRRGGQFFEHDYAHGFETDFTPEEVFNMFFGGGFPADSLNRRRQRAQHQHHDETNYGRENPLGPILQLLPLIAILVLGVLAQLMVGDPAFSLHQSNKYTVKRETSELRVPFFVRPDFESSYRGRVRQVEQQVEDEYIQQLRMNCYKEQNLKETKIYRARWMRDESLLREAERMAMPSCQRLQQIYNH